MNSAAVISRLFDIPDYQLKVYPRKNALVSKAEGEWQQTSSEQYVIQANKISRGLLALGVKPNDKIAMISSTNRTEWNICDIGILQTGAQNVPIYPTISKEDYLYILQHSEADYCIVSDVSILEKLNAIKEQTSLKAVFTFDEIEGERNWKELLDLGDSEKHQEELTKRKLDISSDDVATIIYTSGTTGKPKGVMLTHGNIVSNVLAIGKRIPLDLGKDQALSFLPLCHIFERMVGYLYQYSGIAIYYAESMETITTNLQEVQPQNMTSVPRLYEKVYDRIIEKGSSLSGLKKRLFYWAVDLGLQYEPYGANGWWYEFRLSIARKLIFSKWQQALGGNIKIMVSGGAALSHKLLRIFSAAGLPIMEGYGLTETSPVIAVNDLQNKGFKIGTVGRVIEGVEVKIAEDGEILVKGPNIMKGYYKDPERTREVMSGAYFHTGDIGTLDSDNFLSITDRKKEIFKTSGGKYIAPTNIENLLKLSRFIEQVMVVGEGEKMPAAIIQPHFEFIKDWAKRKQLEVQNTSDLIQHPLVLKRIQQEIENVNKQLGTWERIKAFVLTPDVWSVDEGQLTPKMSMKRKAILEMYRALYNKMYGRVD